MIPKKLFFIWLGNDQPDYVNFSVNTFKKVNPTFEVNLIRYTVDDLENRKNVSKYDHNVYNCLDYVLNNNGPYVDTIKSYKNMKRKTIQVIGNILRLDLLNEYGGIYLDCDTFPLKPFDDWIINRHSFCAHTFTTSDYFHREKDCHFIGNCLGSKINNFYSAWSSLNVNKYNFINDPYWILRRKLFFMCQLDYIKKNDEYYIEHFCDRTWQSNKTQSCRTPLCKYDT